MSPLWFWDGPQDWLPCNVTAPAYAPPMGTFPVDPADVPPEAVAFLKRQLVRHGPEVDDYEARVMIAGLIAVLAPAEATGTVTAPRLGCG